MACRSPRTHSHPIRPRIRRTAGRRRRGRRGDRQRAGRRRRRGAGGGPTPFSNTKPAMTQRGCGGGCVRHGAVRSEGAASWPRRVALLALFSLSLGGLLQSAGESFKAQVAEDGWARGSAPAAGPALEGRLVAGRRPEATAEVLGPASGLASEGRLGAGAAARGRGWRRRAVPFPNPRR